MSSPLEDLQEDSSRPGLLPDIFPVRFQAVIFRNWNMAPLENIAAVIGATVSQTAQAAQALGLGAYRCGETESWLRHGYLTIIRQNWELLNFEALLVLLGWKRERLVKTLREEDFFWHKLGDAKPRCQPVRYRALDAAETAATAAIREVVAPLFAAGTARDVEQPFDFLARYAVAPADVHAAPPSGKLRMIYSYCASCGDALDDDAPDPLPPGLLAEYAASGVNAVWMPLLLTDLVAWHDGDDRRGEGEPRRAIRRRNLAGLARKCRQFGIALYGYLNEPRAMPEAEFAAHPDWAGTPNTNGDGTRAVCVRHPEVAAALRRGVAELCRAVPELGGFFAITMSENLTHCHSRGTPQCPRCPSSASPAEAVVTVLRAIHDGMADAGTGARLIAWNWGWSTDWDAEVVRALPPEIDIMCVSETGLDTCCRGVGGKVADYSIAHPGPGPVAPRLWRLAQDAGHRAIAKLQLNATWELSSLPYIPVPQLVKSHLEHVAACGVENFMLSWTLGGAPGGNLPLVDCSLRELLQQRFGASGMMEVEAALAKFSAAFAEFPFNETNLIYTGPQNFGCANLLWREPTRRRATMVGFCYDDLWAWSGGGHYSYELLEQVFSAMSRGWEEGLALLDRLPEPCRRQPAVRELRQIAEAGYCIIASVANQIAFYRKRDAHDLKAMAEIAGREAELALRLLAAQRCDSRIGFEASNHYMYHANALIEKVLNCRAIAG